VYALNGEAGVSWYQPFPRWSLEQIRLLLPDRSSALVDIGAGDSTLVDGLLLEGYQNITLLDCSAVALSLTRARLLANSNLAHHWPRVCWLQTDLLNHEFPYQSVDGWHDRAVFHFLTTETDRHRYRQRLDQALRPGGFLFLSTFAEEGPVRCSGHPVVRYSIETLEQAVGPSLKLVHHEHQRHRTPVGRDQIFLAACFRAPI
jgi:SAM-dependent methyltransferase